MKIFIPLLFSLAFADTIRYKTPFNTSQLDITVPENASDIMIQWAQKLGQSVSKQIQSSIVELITNLVPIQAMNMPKQATLDELGKTFQSNSTRDRLPNFNKKFPKIEGIDSSQVRWLAEADNRKPEDPIIYYLHGGGYVSRMQTKYYGILGDLYHQLKNERLSIAVLDYTPVTDATYPQQLYEAAIMYNALSNSSKNIWIEGDSAGGHLALNLLRHAKYPVDGVPKLKTENENAAQGLVLYSPVVSIAKNESLGGIDMVYDLFVPNTTERNSAPLNPAYDNITWSDVLPDNKTNIFLQYGQDEFLREQIENFLRISKLSETTATITMEEHGQHDAFALGKSDVGAWEKIVKFHRTTMLS